MRREHSVAFSSDTARHPPVMQLVQGFAYNDPARARTLVAAYLTDPAARAQAERIPEAAANGGQPRAGLEVVRGPRGAPAVVQRLR